MPLIKLKNGKLIELSAEVQNKMAVMFAMDDMKQVKAGGAIFNLSDVEDFNYKEQLSMIDRLKARGLNTDWYYKTK